MIYCYLMTRDILIDIYEKYDCNEKHLCKPMILEFKTPAQGPQKSPRDLLSRMMCELRLSWQKATSHSIHKFLITVAIILNIC